MKLKTFIHALQLLSLDPVKAKSYLDDKRLSNKEKIILQSYFYLRDNELEKVIESLDGIGESSDKVLEGQRQLLLGLTANNQSHFVEAYEHINLSLRLLKDQNLNYFEYLGLYNQFIIAFNMKDQKRMQNVLFSLEKIPVEKESDRIMILRCYLNYYTFINQFGEAHKIIHKIHKICPKLTESDEISYLIDKLNLSVKEENFSESLKILGRMKKFRKFHLTENYNFIKILLNNIIHDEPIYFSHDQFIRIPLLNFQMQTIRALEEGKQDEAQQNWTKLNELNPDIYGENFNYQGDKTLFSIAFHKHLSKIKKTDIPLEQDSSQHNKILKLLQEANNPINRDIIYFAVYGKKAENKDDYLRLSKVIYRLKKKLNLELSFKKGCYQLKVKKSAA